MSYIKSKKHLEELAKEIYPFEFTVLPQFLDKLKAFLDWARKLRAENEHLIEEAAAYRKSYLICIDRCKEYEKLLNIPLGRIGSYDEPFTSIDEALKSLDKAQHADGADEEEI